MIKPGVMAASVLRASWVAVRVLSVTAMDPLTKLDYVDWFS
jgi:hypothetical protein